MSPRRRVIGTAVAALVTAGLGGCGDGDAAAPAVERWSASDLLAYAGGAPAAAMTLAAEPARRLAAGDGGPASLLGASAVAAAGPLAELGLADHVLAAVVVSDDEDGPAWVAWLLDDVERVEAARMELGRNGADADVLVSAAGPAALEWVVRVAAGGFAALDGDILVTAAGPAGLRAARAAAARADADSPLRRDLAAGGPNAPVRFVGDAPAVARAFGADALAPRLRGARLHAESRADGSEVRLALRGLEGTDALPAGAEAGWELPSQDTIGVSVSLRDPAELLVAATPLPGATGAGGRSVWERRLDRALGIDVRDELLGRMSALTVAIEAACPPPGLLACHPAVTLQAQLDEPRRFARALRRASSRLPALFRGLGFGPLRVTRDGEATALVTRQQEQPVAYAIHGAIFVAQVGVMPLRVGRTESAPDLRGRMAVRGSGAVLRSILPRWKRLTPALDRVLAALGRFQIGVWADGADVFASLKHSAAETT